MNRGCSRKSLVAATSLALFSGVSPGHTAATNTTVALKNVTIVDLRDGRLLERQTVVWDRSRILTVGLTSDVDVPADTLVIQANGTYLLPGFWDMHVHLNSSGSADELDAAEQLTLPLFVAHGVTSVRDMADLIGKHDYRASALPRLRSWDAEVRAGLRIGPRIVAAGSFPVDGPGLLEGQWYRPDFFGAATPASARKLVRYLVDERRPDFIKVYSRIPRDSYFALMEEARRAGILVAGHKPLAVSFVEAANAGQRSIEHAREILLDSFPGAQELQRTSAERDLPPHMLRTITHEHDEAMLHRILDALVRNGIYYVPTHLTRRFDWQAAAAEPSFLNDPRLPMLHPAAEMRARADARKTLARISGREDVETYRQFMLLGMKVTRRAHDAGVRILVGTDSGDSWCFPGSSFHEEMVLLRDAGLSPLAILRAATVVPAEFMGRADDVGTIAPGKLADLVLLDANPLADIAHSRSIRAVVLNGRLLDREVLDEIERNVRLSAQRLRANTRP